MCHGFWLCNQCNVKGKVVLIPVHPCHVCLVKRSVVRRDCRQVAAAGLSSCRRPSACLRFKSSIGASSTEFVSVQPSRLPSQHAAVYSSLVFEHVQKPLCDPRPSYDCLRSATITHDNPRSPTTSRATCRRLPTIFSRREVLTYRILS